MLALALLDNDVNLMGVASYEWYFFGSTAPTALTTTAGVQGSKTLRVVHSTTSTPAFNEKVTTGAGIKNSVVSVDTHISSRWAVL